MKKIRRLEDALAAWRALAPGTFPRAQVRREIRQLKTDIAALTSSIGLGMTR